MDDELNKLIASLDGKEKKELEALLPELEKNLQTLLDRMGNKVPLKTIYKVIGVSDVLLNIINSFDVRKMVSSKEDDSVGNLTGYLYLIPSLFNVRNVRHNAILGTLGKIPADFKKCDGAFVKKLAEARKEASTPQELLKRVKKELCTLIKSAKENGLLEGDELGDLKEVLRKI